jgi:hypothetical protein
MVSAYWSHANNLAIEQLHSFGWGKDSRFSELIILGDREFSQFGLEYGDHEPATNIQILCEKQSKSSIKWWLPA